MFVEYFTVFLDLMEVKTKSGSFFTLRKIGLSDV